MVLTLARRCMMLGWHVQSKRAGYTGRMPAGQFRAAALIVGRRLSLVRRCSRTTTTSARAADQEQGAHAHV